MGRGAFARRGPRGRRAEWAEVLRRKVRGVGRMPMSPCGGKIGAGGALALDGKLGRIDRPNRVLFLEASETSGR